MCGIAGLALSASASPPDPAVLHAMLAALAHRGPDGSGEVINGQVALGHRRLAIIDPAGGAQPMQAGGTALVGNAEIYNHIELRARLPAALFQSRSDCEAALHLWRARNGQCAAELRGMYAIAIHDSKTSLLSLCRDPFGIKQLYYAQIPGGLAFASEPRALLAANLARRMVRPQAAHELLQLQFTTGPTTIFPDINRVLPGETLRISNGTLVGRERASLMPERGPAAITMDQALHRLDHALTDSITVHLRSDVPLGLFLSGGLDSTTLLACLTRQGVRLAAYTAGFDVPGAADEREHAASLAQAASVKHVALEITQTDMLRHLPAIAACMDDPAADYAIIPTWFLARRARQDVKVVLSGEGGDELLAGYGRYRRAARPWWLGGRRMRAHGAFAGTGVLRDDAPTWRDGWAAAENAISPSWSRLQAAQATDIAEWLPNDLLLKLDRCLMTHGVEGRTPLLDPAVAAASFALPDNLKIRGRSGKVLLREWLTRNFRAANVRAPKQGFTVPVGTWIAAHGDRLGDLVASLPCIQEIGHPSRVRALFRAAAGRREGQAAWSLLFYALWHRAHIEALASDGDVFTALAAR